jgi:hypothetical protein
MSFLIKRLGEFRGKKWRDKKRICCFIRKVDNNCDIYSHKLMKI